MIQLTEAQHDQLTATRDGLLEALERFLAGHQVEIDNADLRRKDKIIDRQCECGACDMGRAAVAAAKASEPVTAGK